MSPCRPLPAGSPRLMLLLLLPSAAATWLAAAAAANFYLLPAGHPRCRGAASRLRCLDQSLLLEADAQPDEALLDTFLLCNSSWAALGCQRDDVGELAWRLAFRLSSVPCGQRFVLTSSLFSPLLGQGLAGGPPEQQTEFTCRSHAYPALFRPRFRFTSLTWHRSNVDGSSNSPLPSPSPSPALTISAHVYAEFGPNVKSVAERAALCEFRGGFWCGRAGLGCVYGTHRCNGLDDCLNASPAAAGAETPNVSSNASASTTAAIASATSAISADEADCRYYDNGPASSGFLSDSGVWRPAGSGGEIVAASSRSSGFVAKLCLAGMAQLWLHYGCS